MYNMQRPEGRILLPLLALSFLMIPVSGLLDSVCTNDGGTIYDYSFVGLDGSKINLTDYSGKAVLVVNVATF